MKEQLLPITMHGKLIFFLHHWDSLESQFGITVTLVGSHHYGNRVFPVVTTYVQQVFHVDNHNLIMTIGYIPHGRSGVAGQRPHNIWYDFTLHTSHFTVVGKILFATFRLHPDNLLHITYTIRCFDLGTFHGSWQNFICNVSITPW